VRAILSLEPPKEEPLDNLASRAFVASAESRTVVAGGSKLSKAARGRELAGRVGFDRCGAR
jgi:hypothetical protein